MTTSPPEAPQDPFGADAAVADVGPMSPALGTATPAGQLPRIAPILIGVIALACGALVGVLFGSGPAAMIALAWVVYVLAYPGWSLLVEGRRKATDRLVTVLVWTAFALAMIPLVSLLVTVVAKGAPAFSANFFTADLQGRALIEGNGGIFHALVGTLLVTALAALIAIPIGLMTAIWLVEYGKGTRLASVITFLVDVMTGIPSIVAGLFALAFYQVILNDPLPRLAFGS